MSQLSMFAADASPAELTDVAGLLAAHGQSGLGDSGASISIVVDEHWRAVALAAILDEAGIGGTISEFDGSSSTGRIGSTGSTGIENKRHDDPGTRYTFSTERTRALAGLVRQWRKGAVKAVPDDWTPTAGQLRVWVLAAGRSVASSSFGLGIDEALEQHAPQRDALLGALQRAGLTATYVRTRGSGPLLRITSAKRLNRLAESVGARPDGVPVEAWPAPALR